MYPNSGALLCLTVNRIWGEGGSTPPPVARFFREKYRHFTCIWFLDLVTKTLLANFKKNHDSSGPGELSRDLFSTGVNKNLQFSFMLKQLNFAARFLPYTAIFLTDNVICLF